MEQPNESKPETPKALYQCLSCSEVFAPDMISTREIKCPYCGYRIIKKVRSGGLKMVKAE